MANEVNATLRLQVKEEVTSQMAKARGELQKFEKQSQSVKGNVRDLFRELAGPVAGLGVGAALGTFVTESIRAASALEGLDARARVIYGSAFPRMEFEANRLGQSLGRSGSDLLEFSTDMASVLSGAGIGGQALRTMSTNISRLAVDFGSFFRIADAEAFDVLRGAILGMTRPLTRLGIVMNENTLEAYRLSEGIQTQVSDMTEAQLMALRYNFILDKTQKIQGDASRNAGLLSNRTKELSAQWKDFQEVAGKPILGVLAEGLWTVNTALGAVSKGIKLVIGDWITYAKVVGNLFGADVATKDYRGPELKSLSGNLSIEDVRGAAVAAKQADVAFAGGGGGGGGGGGAEKGAEKLKRLKEALTDVGRTYTDKRREITRDLKELENAHRERMGDINEQIQGTEKQLQGLGSQYQKTLRDIQKAQRELDESRSDLTNSVDDQVVEQINKIGQLQERAKEAAAQNGSLNTDQIVGVLANRQDKDGALTYRDRLAFMLSDNQAEQVNVAVELEREQKALKEYVDAKLGVSQKLKEDLFVGSTTFVETARKIIEATPQLQAAKDRTGATDFEKFLKDTQGKSRDLAENQQDLTQRRADEKLQHDERKKELEAELTKLNDKKNLETQAYVNQRQQFELTKIALLAFETDYTLAMNDIDKVTQDTVDNLKTRLEELRDTISQIDALTAARADLTGGGTIAQRRADRLANTPDSFLTQPAPQTTSGGVTINISSMNIAKEADADEVMRRITREVQKKLLEAP